MLFSLLEATFKNPNYLFHNDPHLSMAPVVLLLCCCCGISHWHHKVGLSWIPTSPAILWFQFRILIVGLFNTHAIVLYQSFPLMEIWSKFLIVNITMWRKTILQPTKIHTWEGRCNFVGSEVMSGLAMNETELLYM